MGEIFSNSWFVGIGGSLIASLIVFFVSRFFLKKKQSRDYRNRINSANQELLHIVRPLLVENTVPSEEKLDSIISSLAAKFGIWYWDLLDGDELADELVREVYQNHFLTAKEKDQYSKIIDHLRPKEDEELEEDEELAENKREAEEVENRTQKSITAASISISVMVLSVSIGYTIISQFYSDHSFVLRVTALVLAIIGISILIVTILRMRPED